MAKTRHIPERRCVACGQKLPKRDLIRVVRTPQGTVTVDPTGKGAGRGAYICTSSDCWSKGLSKGNLDRSLAVSISAEDRDRILDFYRQHVSGTTVTTQ
ncbi:MAG: hypothetical protein BZY88_12440 [SAR202 cluster bacterium Io17-Chloro-G9]|nr:MAG: hypothetical protein BZY88_12440 [SAR202 cluster bacterium Io17-Chloro-G9]